MKTHLYYFSFILSFLHSPLDHSLAPVARYSAMNTCGNTLYGIHAAVTVQFHIIYSFK